MRAWGNVWVVGGGRGGVGMCWCELRVGFRNESVDNRNKEGRKQRGERDEKGGEERRGEKKVRQRWVVFFPHHRFCALPSLSFSLSLSLSHFTIPLLLHCIFLCPPFGCSHRRTHPPPRRAHNNAELSGKPRTPPTFAMKGGRGGGGGGPLVPMCVRECVPVTFCVRRGYTP